MGIKTSLTAVDGHVRRQDFYSLGKIVQQVILHNRGRDERYVNIFRLVLQF